MLKLGKSKVPACESEISALEADMDASVPDEFREFVMRHNGAEPETNIFQLSDDNDSGVNGFIPVARIMKERGFIEQEIPSTAIPVAWAEGGDFVCLDLESGRVFFWDHEQPALKIDLAASFTDFLALLQPFDVSTITLKPGQVKSVWVDPALLE